MSLRDGGHLVLGPVMRLRVLGLVLVGLWAPRARADGPCAVVNPDPQYTKVWPDGDSGGANVQLTLSLAHWAAFEHVTIALASGEKFQVKTFWQVKVAALDGVFDDDLATWTDSAREATSVTFEIGATLTDKDGAGRRLDTALAGSYRGEFGVILRTPTYPKTAAGEPDADFDDVASLVTLSCHNGPSINPADGAEIDDPDELAETIRGKSWSMIGGVDSCEVYTTHARRRA